MHSWAGDLTFPPSSFLTSNPLHCPPFSHPPLTLVQDPPYQELFNLTSPSLTTTSYSSYFLKTSLPSLPPIFHPIEISGCLEPSTLPECGQALVVFTQLFIQPGHAVPPSVHLLPKHSAHHPSDIAAWKNPHLASI